MVFSPSTENFYRAYLSLMELGDQAKRGLIEHANDQEVLELAFPDWKPLPYPEFGAYGICSWFAFLILCSAPLFL